ncbi:acyl-CoA dehydratase activase [Shigella flexneri]
MTEISCHGLGARFLAPATRAVIDVGGQDSKVIQLDDDGNLCDFLMNDKCAAGTGRSGGDVAHAWHQRRATRQHYRKCHAACHHEYVHSVCRIRSDQPALSGRRARSDSRRVINAMARRSANFIARLSCEAPILFTGGVSHCQTFARMLECHLGMPVNTHPDAQFAGAIGAAVIGQRVRTRR